MITLYNMDVMKALKQMPSESVDMQITSPPYWGLRDYGVEGQIGLEPDFNDYIKRMCDIFDEVKRVLKKDGTCWVNLGDTYSSQPSGTLSGAFADRNNIKATFKQRKNAPLKYPVQTKCLTMIPERFALEMINRGWILRNKIIWHKPNHMPTSVKDRFANSWEYLFMFSKSKKYYFDLDAVREPHQIHSVERACRGRSENNKSMRLGQYAVRYAEDYKGYEDMQGKLERGELRAVHPKGRNPDDIIQTKFEIGDGYRQGMNRDESELIKYRPNLPSQKEFVDKLRENFTVDELIKKGLKRTTVEHWFRYDESGFSYPTKEEWKIVNTDLFPELLKTKLKPNAVMANPAGRNPDDVIKYFENKQPDGRSHFRLSSMIPKEESYHELGKNPSDFWDITTHPYKEAHFAVFPEKLVERPIKTTRKNGVILDIFAGSGTTLKVARDLKRDAIGIEIKKEYCNLIYKRLFGENQTTLFDSFKLKI